MKNRLSVKDERFFTFICFYRDNGSAILYSVSVRILGHDQI